jgi:hypothetical protein
MANFPTYEQWMKATHSLTSPRSEHLKALDEAIKGGEANKAQIKDKLDRWIFDQARQGKKWVKSVRNQSGAVSKLHRLFYDVMRNPTPEQIEAIKYISRMQALALQKQFMSTKVQFKSSTLIGMKQGASSKLDKVKNFKSVVDGGRAIYGGIKEIKSVGQPAGGDSAITKKIKELVIELCPGLNPDTIMANLGLTHFKSGAKAVSAWIDVAKTGWQRYGVTSAIPAVRAGDPAAGLKAVHALLVQTHKEEVARASTATVAFGGKLAAALADGGGVTGPVIGLLETLAEIFQTIVEYVRDYKEMQKINELLRVGAFNMDLFTASPLLGCYFVLVQDHSTIINYALADFGQENWMVDIERLRGEIDPLLTAARRLVHASKLELMGVKDDGEMFSIKGSKGIVEEGYSVKTGLSKLLATPDHIKSRIENRIEAWLENPQKPPAWDKSRIQGFGSDG